MHRATGLLKAKSEWYNWVPPTRNNVERKLQYLETTITGAIGTIILDHPERRNALSRQLVDAVVGTLNRFSRERTRVVVLRARGVHPEDYSQSSFTRCLFLGQNDTGKNRCFIAQVLVARARSRSAAPDR